MQLVGMLDSPYVRRVAISLKLMRLPFVHRPLSVFSTFEAVQAINPVVKVPTLVCEDTMVLMDSTLILMYAESMPQKYRSLMPVDPSALQRTLRQLGLALAACEKSVQVVYEHQLRPAEKWHQPWLQRVSGQLRAAFDLLEADLDGSMPCATSAEMDQAGVTVAVAWRFAQCMVPQCVPASDYPQLQAFSTLAETLPEFATAPHGPSTCTETH